MSDPRLDYFKPATQDTTKPPWNRPATGSPGDPVPARQAPNLPPPERPATANPEQVDHFFKVAASDPARCPNDPLTKAGRMKP
jgi:hypothetical protein